MLPSFVGRIFKTCLRNVYQVSRRSAYVPVYMPRRALLYVPGDDEKKINKSFTVDVDCVTLDCEDGVALNRKTQARSNIRNFLDKGKPDKQRTYDFAVRVNSLDSGALKDDLSVILTGKNRPDTILLPKVDGISHLQTFAEYLNEYIPKEKDIKIQVIMGIESAISLINLTQICIEAHKLAEKSKFYPVALLFGSDDFCASIGATRTDDAYEVLYARQKIVVAAKAFTMQAIDMVHIKFKDLEGLKVNAEAGAKLGFTGKQIIHPDQVEVTQKAFSPTEEKVLWAQALIKEFYRHQTEGKGAFDFHQQMIDMPTLRQAQNIVDLMNAVMIRQ